MAVFKCKMCGGTIEFNPGDTVGVCDSCGTKQTLPRLDDDRRANLYDRANHFRRNNEFDKAMGIYETILNEDPTDAEAYWSLVLCKYGVEYVEDPTTRRRVPTVNRAQYTSVLADEDYKAAVKNADAAQKALYEAEAKAIDEIQKGILEISQKEEPFDVFICYKETDAQGRRTVDSVRATELYHELTKEGFKVFFARITLEDKLGTAYEPYIFAALNSAKVMVVLGTKPEHFNAVWVKNEWSRYLALIRAGAQKTLIPAYQDMDPYDLPEEFSHLQAQDMSKLGFMQDLIRGVKKLTAVDEPKPAVKETVVVSQPAASASAAPLLERAFMFLEDGKWAEADEYCEKVLDLEPKNARAYLGKLMAQLQVRTEAGLKNAAEPFDGSDNAVKAARFDPAIAEQLKADNAFIRKRNETARKDAVYADAATRISPNSIEANREAIKLFESIIDWKDSRTKIDECNQKIEEIILAAERAAEKRKREDDERRIAAEKAAKKRKQMIALAGLIVSALIVFVIILTQVIIPSGHYKKAAAAAESGDVLTAALEYEKAGNYKEASEKSVVLWERFQKSITGLLAAGSSHTVGLKADGTVVATGENDDGQCDVDGWKELVAVAAGDSHTVGLKADGTVVATGENDDGECDVDGWKDIVAVAAGGSHTVGLKADGTVIATKYLGNQIYYDGECDVDGWTDIIAVAAGSEHTVGLKVDGTVVATGENDDGECDVDGWTNIVAVAAGRDCTVGLKADGTVVATKYLGDQKYYDGECDVEGWTDIVAVSAGSYHTVGLKADGTVVATKYLGDQKYYHGQCDVDGWTDIVAVSAGWGHTVGLKADGTVVATKYLGDQKYYYGQCDVDDWKNMKLPKDNLK